MSGKRTTLEKQIKAEVKAEIFAEPDVLGLENTVGSAKYFTDAGKAFHVPYGLGKGSPDLVSILRVTIGAITVGVWFCLEVKPAEGELEPEQIKCHAIWRRFGALVEVVRSAAEARAALERARNMFRKVAA